MEQRHVGDGGDDLGRDLEVTIRIGPGGRMYFNDITHDLLPVALALCPDDPDLLTRKRAAEAFDSRRDA